MPKCGAYLCLKVWLPPRAASIFAGNVFDDVNVAIPAANPVFKKCLRFTLCSIEEILKRDQVVRLSFVTPGTAIGGTGIGPKAKLFGVISSSEFRISSQVIA